MTGERSARRRRVTVTLLLVALGCCAAALYAERRAARPQSQVQGQVVSARAYEINAHWHRDVEFRYQRAGVTYQARDSRLLRRSFKNEAEVLASAPELSPGSKVLVYYDESAPGAATLDPGPRSFRFFAAAGVLWFGLACLWFAYDRTQHRA
ncbi:MAG TPA: DUF3592 domain-containing protein [Polyangiaceae bacterium]